MSAESRVRNRALAAAAVLTFCAAALYGLGVCSGWLVWALVTLTAVLLVAAVDYQRPRALFVTERPQDWPEGSSWRRWVIVGRRRLPEGSWAVLGRRAW